MIEGKLNPNKKNTQRCPYCGHSSVRVKKLKLEGEFWLQEVKRYKKCKACGATFHSLEILDPESTPQKKNQ